MSVRSRWPDRSCSDRRCDRLRDLGHPLRPRSPGQLTNAPVDVQIFRPAMDSKGFITLNSSARPGTVRHVLRPRRDVRAQAAAVHGHADARQPGAEEHLQRRQRRDAVAAGRDRLHEAPAPRHRARRHPADQRAVGLGPAEQPLGEPGQPERRHRVLVHEAGPRRHPGPPEVPLPQRHARRPRPGGHPVGHPADGRQERLPRRGQDDLPAVASSSTPRPATSAASAPPSTSAGASAAASRSSPTT